MVELRGFKVNSLEVENRAVPGTELKLQNQVKYNVNYMDGDSSVQIAESLFQTRSGTWTKRIS